ncbi:MAG: MAPEG family protein [Labilithrix sp.]|nr:MAPEG family protein [Labilithrix sp.]
MDFAHTPAFTVYALFATFLSLLAITLDAAGGFSRARSKTVINPEDVGKVAKKVEVVDEDPPSVARMMRAHRNALANIVPFLVIGLLYVALGAPAPLTVGILFGLFTFARLVHAISYAAKAQPWRTISFVVGQGVTVTLAVLVARAALG